ncbi:hypothetical protein EV363DRAFT_1585307 [Boletus edulis]|nr:hypothetical protein EV363DRAFT_1224749 [Boletus edulis]KAF8127544.1 hypothetical protein EV363DRAFT_1585307 [Boletus edulis]
MSYSEGPGVLMSWATQRREASIANVVFAASLLLPVFLPFASPLFQLPEFAPPQLIYSRDLVSLLLAPWVSPSSMYRVLSRLLQSALLLCLPQDSIPPCYLLWIAIGLSRTLVGFLLSRSVGWTYPSLFNHWALYESSGGCGPPLVTYLLVSGVRPDFSVLLVHLRGYRWEVTESFVLLVACTLLAGLDHAPWTYGIAVGLAIIVITFRAVFAACHPPEIAHMRPSPESHPGSHHHLKRHRAGFQMILPLIVFIPLPKILSTLLASPPTFQMPSLSKHGVPSLEILILSYPRPNDTPSSPDHHSILSQTIASYLPYISSSTALSVFTHASPSTHSSFADAQQRFRDAPVTFHADQDTHPDANPGQYLHLAEAFRWIVEKGAMSPEWIMLVEDDFPICGEWGWKGVLRVMQALERGHNTPSPETTKIWGGFVGTGGSGLILHHTLLPILANTLRLHALANSPFPPFMARRPADIVIQDCLLGADPLCPTAPSSKDMSEGIWLARRQPTMVITSRLIMDHIGATASTGKGRLYDANKWRCGWRHPFHGRPEITVVPM